MLKAKNTNHQPVPVKEMVFFDDIRRNQPAIVIKDGLSITLNDKKISVEINECYDKYYDLFDVIFYNVGVFYSIAPSYFAHTVELVRPIQPKILDLINLYYKRVSLDAPIISVAGIEFFEPEPMTLDDNKAVISLSGGKDSVYALVKAVEQYGKHNVVAVYIDNIMKQCPETEESASVAVCSMLDVKLIIVRISNSFKRHKGILNGAEIALAAGLVIPIAAYYGASKVILGTIESEVDIFQVQAPTFSETIIAINMFNEFLEGIGVNIRIFSGVPKIDTPMKYLMPKYPQIMAEAVSCMMKSNHLISHIKRSRKNYPGFPFYKRMCGVCPKCMMINVFRMRYEESFKEHLTNESVAKYCLRVLKSVANERLSFKTEIIDEMEEILDETLRLFESDF